MEKTLSLGKKELRHFGLIMGAIIAGIFGLALPLVKGREILLPAVAIGAAFFIFAGAAPKALAPVYRAWMWIGAILGWINTRIILGVVFFVMMVPVAFALRVLRKDPLKLKLEKDRPTYRVNCPDPKAAIANMDKPF